MILAVEAEGMEITTLEGCMKGEELGPVQQAFLEQDAFQCGYCTPGRSWPWKDSAHQPESDTR